MENNETALEMCLRMLKERADYWRPRLGEYFTGLGDAYSSAANLLEYAMQDNIECLRQFDYYHEKE